MLIKKVASLAALTLLLATAQLALAQQNTDQTQSVKTTFQATGGTQATGETQTAGGGQTTSPDPAQQQGDLGTEDQGAAVAPTPTVGMVSIQDFSFGPADAGIESGDAIIFVNEGNEPHTVTADDGQFDSGPLNPWESVPVSLEGSGTLMYHCAIHPSMVGSVAVGESGVGAPPPAEELSASPAA